MSIFDDLYNSRSEVHLTATEGYMIALKTFIDMFNRTKPGVNYYTTWTDEDNKKCNIKAAESAIHVIDNIIKKDRVVYRVVNALFKDEIKEMREVLSKT